MTVIETNAGKTASTLLPVTPPEMAVIVVAPVAMPLAKPVPEMVATAGAEDVQAALAVMSCVLPSE